MTWACPTHVTPPIPCEILEILDCTTPQFLRNIIFLEKLDLFRSATVKVFISFCSRMENPGAGDEVDNAATEYKIMEKPSIVSSQVRIFNVI